MKQEINVLLIENNRTEMMLVKQAIAHSDSLAVLHWEQTLESGIMRLNEEAFDIVLADLAFPDGDYCETVSQVYQAARGTPVVVLTDHGDEQHASKLIDLGVEDYLVKSEVTPSGLQLAIRNSIQRHENSTQIKKLLQEVKQKTDLLARKNIKLARLNAQANEFVDNVSHEFRTPLTVIREYVSLVRDGFVGDVNDEQVRLLKVAEDRVDDLNTMVDDMLDVSRLEAGMLSVCRKRCEISDIIERVYDALKRKAELKGVELNWDDSDGLPALYCDPEKAARVVTNLTVNAIKFCGENGIVNIRVHDNPIAEEIEVSVSDNGPGMGKDSLAQIFGRFKQLDQSTPSSTKGFGLGLSIVKDLVACNFGTIGVTSKLGQGTEFRFTIPRDNPVEVVRRYLDSLPAIDLEGPLSTISVIQAQVGEPTDVRLQNDLDVLLHSCLRKNDLMFRVDSDRWLIIIPEQVSKLQAYYERIDDQFAATNRNRPQGPLPRLNWELLGSWSALDQAYRVVKCTDEFLRMLPSTC